MNHTEIQEFAAQLQPQILELLRGYHTLQDAFGLTPERIRQVIGMAYELAGQGKLGVASTILGGVSVIDPENALVHSCLGAILMKIKQPESARSELSYAVELNPSDISARVNLGEVSLELGDLNGAIFHLQTAVEQDPSAKNSAAIRARSLLVLISNTVRELQQEGPEAAEKIKEQIRLLHSKKD
jgi:Flp pilus assembly protein TadD